MLLTEDSQHVYGMMENLLAQLRDGDAITEIDLLHVIRFMDYAYTEALDVDENDAEDK
tara:strand:+ start:79 stop:252 length:174 start_codon:yes stop_codon:yes gene_type:complete